MDKDKQIEEIKRDIAPLLNAYVANTTGECWNGSEEDIGKVANRLIEKGYRKQEWISVDERLPKQSGKYLVCTKNGNVYQTKFYSYPERTGGHWGQKDKGKSITHWTDLPLPPKNN